MFRNYLKIALRQLWRNRLYTSLNVVGLSIGLAACWIIFRMVSYEFSFDRQVPNRDRIYRLVSRFKAEGQPLNDVNAGAPKPLGEAIQKQVPGVEAVVPLWDKWYQKVSVVQGSKTTTFRDVSKRKHTTAAYFKMMPYRWLAGNPNTALNAPNQVVLTRSRAELYFPHVHPGAVLGKTLTYDDSIAVKVTGVVDDLGYNTSFESQEFFTMPRLTEVNWAGVSSNDNLYVLLAKTTDPAKVIAQIDAISYKNGLPAFKKYGYERHQELMPLSDVHFSNKMGENMRKADKTVLYGLSGLALFILLLAVVNYINLASVQVPIRAKEIGVRKVLGSSSGSLFFQFLAETLLITLLAMGLAFLWANLYVTHYGDLLPEGSQNYVNWPLVLGFLVVLCGSVSVLAGWYPGWLITRLQPATVLRGRGDSERKKWGLTLRQTLIVFQFVIAQVFIVGALLIGQQLRFLMSQNMGFNREAVIIMDLPFRGFDTQGKDIADRKLFRERLAALPGVEQASLGNAPVNNSLSSNNWDYIGPKGKLTFMLYRKEVDTAFLSLYGIPLLAGRNLQPSDTVREYVINEVALHKMGLQRPQEAIGQLITEVDGKPTPIVGVVKDFHTASLHDTLTPTVLMSGYGSAYNMSVKLAYKNPNDWQPTLAQIEKAWKQLYVEEPFKYQFYDQMIEGFYHSERTISRIINLATAVAILISCLGLFALATFMAQQRTKEIGIRKVLGASVAGIVALLSKDFLKLILLAIVLASPLAWWAITKWLSTYAYRVALSPWLFVGAGLLAVIIALLTVSYQAIRAALMNPVKSLRSE